MGKTPPTTFFWFSEPRTLPARGTVSLTWPAFCVLGDHTHEALSLIWNLSYIHKTFFLPLWQDGSFWVMSYVKKTVALMVAGAEPPL